MVRSKHTIATPPGETIREQLEDRGMTQKEFAVRMGISEKHISKLINGEVLLTTEMALKLELVLGIPASFWNNLEAIYREKLARVEMENKMEEEAALASKFPYQEMAKNGWVKNVRAPRERVHELRKFFEVTRLSAVLDEKHPIACRRMAETEKGDYALLAWNQRAKLEARERIVQQIDVKKLEQIIPEIRSMTVKDPSKFCSQLTAMLADCGIVIVYLPSIGGSFLHGATFIDNKKIIVGMTIRGKDADRFWFSLFHELGHIVLKHVFSERSTTEEEEQAADAFASDVLIPADAFEQFVTTNRNHYTEPDIKTFAAQVGVAPGIVVGRLQKMGEVGFNRFNHLKDKYKLVS